ncbi:uncharacterized protein LOC143057953 [Mytilus galloprovincialis]|uniref:uncharacterized protein LOC143057953 n=1 Tax=Mytilus galloprovincialis TaxID=29158 RepID=UPI003F7BFA3B
MGKLLHFVRFALFVGQVYPCCLPEKVEGKMVMSIGLKNNGDPLTITAIYDKWVMDTTIAKSYLSGTLYVQGQAIHQKVFQDYSQGIQFELAMGNCTVKPLPFSFTSIGRKLCLPPSTKIMTSYYGSALETLDFDMYLIPIHGGQMTMSLTPKGCAPISESISTEEGVFNFGFMGLTSGITDPSVFEMPQSCKNLQGMVRKRDVGQSPFIPSI